MNLARPALISLGVVVGMLAASAWAWPHALPSAPVHWGLDGTPDRWGSRAEALGVMPVVAAALTALFAALPWLMPRQGGLERSATAYSAMWIAVTALLAIVHVGLVSAAVGSPLDMPRIVGVAMGAVFVVLGNYLGKVRYNYVIGLRLPWTLASERVWDRTHRFAGPLVLAGGLIMAVVALLAPSDPEGARWTLAAILACTLAPLAVASAYGWRLSRSVEA